MLLFLPYGAGALAMARHKETMPDASEEVWQERLRGEQVWVLGLNYEGALSGDRSSDNLPNCRLRPVNRRERVPGRDSPRLPIQETPHCNEGFDDAKIVSATYGAAASTANAWTEVLQVDGDVLDRLQMLHGRRLWYGSRDPPPLARLQVLQGCRLRGRKLHFKSGAVPTRHPRGRHRHDGARPQIANHEAAVGD